MDNDIFIEEISKIKVYIRVDENNNITDINSSVFLTDIANWIEIDEGIGDKYAHAQGNYFEKPITTDEGIFRYKYLYDVIIEKSQEEIDIEISNLPKPMPSDIDILKAQLKATVERNDFIEDCIAEMAMQLYQ